MSALKASLILAAFGLLAAASADPIAAQASPLPTVKADALLALEQQRFAAMTQQDFATLARLLAPDLSYCHSNGVCETRDEFMRALRSGASRYRKIALLESRVRRYGALAVLNGRIQIEGEVGGVAVKGLELVYTDVYRQSQNNWQLIAWHSSRAPSTATAAAPPR
jgi:ketosteroid isomerase-like protein